HRGGNRLANAGRGAVPEATSARLRRVLRTGSLAVNTRGRLKALPFLRRGTGRKRHSGADRPAPVGSFHLLQSVGVEQLLSSIWAKHGIRYRRVEIRKERIEPRVADEFVLIAIGEHVPVRAVVEQEVVPVGARPELRVGRVVAEVGQPALV